MGILEKLKNKSLFSVSEQAIAKFILSDPSKIARMSIREICRQTYTSPTSVMRLCRKVCDGGFAEFRFQLSQELGNFFRHIEVNENDDGLAQRMSSLTETMKIIEKYVIQTIGLTQSMINPEMMEIIVNRILSSKIIDIYGRGTSHNVGEDFHYKLFRIGLQTHIYNGIEMQLLQAVNSDPTHCAIILSASGETTEIIRIAKILTNKGTPIISLTGWQDNTLLKFSDYPMFFKCLESQEKVGSISSRTAMQYVLDILYFLIINSNYESNTQKIINSYIPNGLLNELFTLEDGDDDE
jgi:DNA-binding MurR/RpiR family transcriptional regulator